MNVRIYSAVEIKSLFCITQNSARKKIQISFWSAKFKFLMLKLSCRHSISSHAIVYGKVFFFRGKMLASKFTVPSSVSRNAAALLLQYNLEGRYLVAFKKLKLTSF